MSRNKVLIRLKGDLPPTPPIPASLQTLACRWMPLGLFDWCRRRLGDRFTLYPLDLPPVVFMSHPADIRAVLGAPSTILRPGAGGGAIQPIVGGRSFMLQDGDGHTYGRRTILPSFSPAEMDEHSADVADAVEAEIDSWPVNTPLVAHPRLRSLSLRIILKSIFGSHSDVGRLHDHVLRMLDVTESLLLVEPGLRRLPGWRAVWRRFIEERRVVDHEIGRLVDGHERTAAGSTVLDRMLRAVAPDGSPSCHAQLRDDIMSIVLAGHETTASEAAWALQLVAHAPRVQDRLAEEEDSGCDGRYLQATVAEILRHRPVFLFAIPREVATPVEIRGWTYRPPAQLLVCNYLVHHDSSVYRSPYSFRPERFLVTSPEPSAWLPWGGGAKRCPGHRLATLELRMILSKVLTRFVVEPVHRKPERARWRSVIITPAQGCRIVLVPRRSSHRPR